MTQRKGTISVQTSDIFPIIKKWLYSEHDIFIRELVANATDAISKRATIARTQNQEIPEGKIEVKVNKTKKIITITDNGLGMSEEEVEKYIAQLAFSGAEEFVKKMQDSGTETNDIIGKFGLGFYSAFMVSDKVEVETLSMNEGATPVHWSCEGDTEYLFSESKKETIGTTITLHINEESVEFLDQFKLSATLRNFCDFMPYPILVSDEEKTTETVKDKDGNETQKAIEPTQVNDTTPLWRKDPSTLKDEDYKDFYRKLYPMDGEPLFWIHLKVDHPFTLEGILYFPKINRNKPFNESNIRLYCKQVFVSDNVKNIIPEFLSLLKGSIDSSDIPLNVSRSSLQGDPNVRRISSYIIKKVGEALKKLYKKDRPRYEQIWEDIGLFIKYGCVSDVKFDELMRERVIFKNSENKYMTLTEYAESIPENYKEKLKDKIIYFEKDKSDYSLKSELLNEKIQTIEIDEYIDPHFIQHVETHKVGDKQFSFSSIDSEIGNIFEEQNTTESDVKIKELFSNILYKDVKEDDPTRSDIEIGNLKNSSTAAYFKVDEQMKRMANMVKSMGQDTPFPIKKTLVVNSSNALVQNALKISEKGGNEALVEKICHHVGDLALISSEGLTSENKESFVKRSQDLIQELSSQLI